ncbi:methylated-DNA--[protein]-cysteine S-methyltransferase [Chitinilyticum piscinae]|uniref:Methylated-DNA--[protein]-cysteine S-methyltransferase n=1 Tax=Chitinilyticum piscinae TaxID=2866724 RepID=A0A8J7G0V4_9NEIS|nr:methylated-DNA--[protein]-cysteine S-methyltransferase [Chitinilyticum piscinae]MBE9609323.1 methylated-DNA--[protein]-cysteine S-methyltransferase [Chitinilyticum piscinae]
MQALDEASRHYALVARSIRYLREHVREQPSLDELAAAVHLSPAHFQRVFSEWAGLSPKRFLQYLTAREARTALLAGRSVLDAALESGLSGTSRLHELLVTTEAMTPAEVRAGGAGVALYYGSAATPFGAALLGWTARGLCHLGFAQEGDGVSPEAERLRQAWPRAALHADQAGAATLAARIFAAQPADRPLHLLLRGSNFQLRVWQALLATRPGERLSYRDLALRAGAARAQRAVGSALAANRLGWLIPCHRVIREDGEVGQFRWGCERKLAMQGWEAGLIDR